ncbi:MAG: hypothetical protein KAU50_06070 [Candidatus Marinimicrobia bacterium]|nr:hypothetical protein [Candidatus Neomarinimicrobiota bacterium]
MNEKMIAVKLAPRLEQEGRGLCDPEDPRNEMIITPSNYNARGYLRVHPSGFIQAMIASGLLIPVPTADDKRGKRPRPGTRSHNRPRKGKS